MSDASFLSLTSSIWHLPSVLSVTETKHFINAGYGWTCKRCAAEDEVMASSQSPHARFFTEGEAEEREPQLSAPTLARWRDATRRILVCPRCGVEERIEEKSRG